MPKLPERRVEKRGMLNCSIPVGDSGKNSLNVNKMTHARDPSVTTNLLASVVETDEALRNAVHDLVVNLNLTLSLDGEKQGVASKTNGKDKANQGRATSTARRSPSTTASRRS